MSYPKDLDTMIVRVDSGQQQVSNAKAIQTVMKALFQ
jgi:hypothetical protein